MWFSAVTFKVSAKLDGSVGSCSAVLRRGPVHLVVAVLKMSSSDLDPSGQAHLLSFLAELIGVCSAQLFTAEFLPCSEILAEFTALQAICSRALTIFNL